MNARVGKTASLRPYMSARAGKSKIWDSAACVHKTADKPRFSHTSSTDHRVPQTLATEKADQELADATAPEGV